MNTTDSCTKPSQIIEECLSDLDSKKECLTATEYRYAYDTIKGIGLLLKEKKLICSLHDETERNAKITKMTRLMAEPGLVPGENEKEVEKSIMARVDLVKTAYLFDKEKAETILLYKEGFLGPPCFNGRVITLQHYVLQRQGIKTDLFYEFSTEIDSSAIQLEEIMYSCVEFLELEKSTPPSLEQLQNYATEKPSIFQEASIDINSKNIKATYSRACEFFVV